MVETPKCRLCGKTDDMNIVNYSEKYNVTFWKCRACNIETKVPLK